MPKSTTLIIKKPIPLERNENYARDCKLHFPEAAPGEYQHWDKAELQVFQKAVIH